MVDSSDGERAAAPPALSDETLVLRARARDLDAFEALVERHEDRLYRLALRLLRDEEGAREVLQEALFAAWRRLDQFEGKAQFGSWLYRIVANAALMALRSRRRHPEVSVEALEPARLEATAAAGGGFGAGPNWARRPDEELQSQELRRHIEEALETLPEGQRLVFLLRDVDDLSTEETADLLGVNVPTVKTRLHRARLALREAITEYFTRA
jgi:RNA polymerase sigma-70 factor (ECF subfamily)